MSTRVQSTEFGTPSASPSKDAGASKGATFEDMEQHSAKASVSDPDGSADSQRFDQSQRNDSLARRWLSVLNFVAPISSAVGLASQDRETMLEQTQAIRVMLEDSYKITDDLKKALHKEGVNMTDASNMWIIRKLLPSVSHMLADHWRQHKNSDSEHLSQAYKALIAEISDVFEGTSSESTLPGHVARMQQALEADDDFQKLPPDIAIKVSMMSAMEPVVSRLSNFSFFVPVENAISRAAEDVVSRANWLYNRYMVDDVSTKARLPMFQSTLRHSAQAYCQAYDDYKGHIFRTLSELSGDEVIEYKASFVDSGKALDNVATDHQVLVGRLHQASKAGANLVHKTLMVLDDESKKKMTTDPTI